MSLSARTESYLRQALADTDAGKDVVDALNLLRPAAPTTITQTYSTADATLANNTALAITDSSGGVDPGNNTIASMTTGGGTYPDATPTKAAIAQLAAKHNALLVDLIDLKQAFNSVVDALQLAGILA